MSVICAEDLIGAEPDPYPDDGLWYCRCRRSFGVGRTETDAKAQWRHMEAFRLVHLGVLGELASGPLRFTMKS